MQFESKISGIPCIIGVTHFYDQEGSYSFNAPSDLDYLGYTEIEFEVKDRKGYPASWLDGKLTVSDRDRIEKEIIERMDKYGY